jgi:hypothetical protein
MSLSKKTSVQIAQQLPEFVRDDSNYANFVLFLEAYYEWLETQYTANANSTIVSTTSQGITYGSKNILNYVDVDETLDEFVQYFINDFLPYVPAEISTDKRKLLKISKQFYQSKGTENSYRFLFRALYGADVELFNTNDAILRASDGKWIVPKFLRIESSNLNWLLTEGFKVFGETSKSYATIDYVKIVDNRTELYISNIQRQFEAGENITVVDGNNAEVYFYNNEVYIQNQGYDIPGGAVILTEKIVGTISAVTVNPNYKGLFYNPGDPVVAYGGLNPDKATPVGLSAEVGDTNLGSLSTLVVVNPSHGYRLPSNTLISITGGGGSNAAAQVFLLDESKFANLTLVTSNTLGAVANVLLGNTTDPVTYTFGGAGVVVPGNTNTTLANTLTFKSFVVAPIGSVQITNAGRNYTSVPSISAQSNYTTDFGTDDFKFLGILQPIQIVNAGINYGNSNTITIENGTGFGAFANITVNAAGSIISANYIYGSSNSAYPLGGLGYDPNYLPTVNISSLSGSNASLVIPGVMATGATFSPTTDSIGSVETITIIDGGEDYVSTPNLSLKVADVAVTNVSLLYPITSGDLIYQGSTLNTSYYAYVDSTLKLSTVSPPNSANDVYQIRTYDYVGSYDSSLPLKINKSVGNTIYTLVMAPSNSYTDEFGNPTTIKRYGDGTARADASFLGGLIVGEGRYLNDDGWLSSLGRVLESKNYNKYTYILSTSQALAKYKELVLNLLHPSGMRLIGRNLLQSANSFNMSSEDALQTGVPLSYVAGTAAYATLQVPVLLASIEVNSQLSAGFYNSFAIKPDNTLWSWGANGNGALGLNTSSHFSSPVQVGTLSDWYQISASGYYFASGSNHVQAIKTDGTLWGWGRNTDFLGTKYAQTGINTTTSYSSPVQIGTLSNWSKVSTGYLSSKAIKTDGTLWAWGALANTNGGDLYSPVQVGTQSNWTKISSGAGHLLILQANGTLWGMSQNDRGELGLSDTTYRYSPVQIGSLSTWTQISAGSTTGYDRGCSMAIKSDGDFMGLGMESIR